MALSITELELQSTEYLPAREVMSTMGTQGASAPAPDGGLFGLGKMPEGGLGLGQAKDGLLGLYRQGVFTQLGR
jgi:hypothetical protein